MTCYSYGDMLGIAVLFGILWFIVIFFALKLLDRWGLLQEDDVSKNEKHE